MLQKKSQINIRDWSMASKIFLDWKNGDGFSVLSDLPPIDELIARQRLADRTEERVIT